MSKLWSLFADDIETGASLTGGTYNLVVTATDRCNVQASATVTVTVTDIVKHQFFLFVNILFNVTK